jgi:hypothetical protein
LELGFGERGEKYMRKKTTEYTNHPVYATVIPDFLPPPEKLVLKENTIKVTLSLNEGSLIFFKKMAKKHGTQYQKMIRNLLDYYVKSYQTQESQNASKTKEKE